MIEAPDLPPTYQTMIETASLRFISVVSWWGASLSQLAKSIEKLVQLCPLSLSCQREGPELDYELLTTLKLSFSQGKYIARSQAI